MTDDQRKNLEYVVRCCHDDDPTLHDITAALAEIDRLRAELAAWYERRRALLPMSWMRDSLAKDVEIDRLKAELEAERDTSNRERCVICGSRAASAEIDRLRAELEAVKSQKAVDRAMETFHRGLALVEENKRLKAELEAEQAKAAEGCPLCGCRTRLARSPAGLASCLACGHSWRGGGG